MTESMEKNLPDRLTINVNGEDKEIFMSAGLLRRCVTVMLGKSSVDLTELYINPEAQSELMVMCLVSRDQRGKASTMSIDDFEFTEQDGQTLFAWITEHILSFFVHNAERMRGDLESPLSALHKLTQSTLGTEGSPSISASAGDTAAA